MKGRILFVATHPKEVASTRYRVLAYEPLLRREGYETTFHPFFPSHVLELINTPGRWAGKARCLLAGTSSRRSLLRAGRYDLVFVHRELFPLGMSSGMALLLAELRRHARPWIYDFDDAVFLPHRQNRGIAGRLENTRSVQDLIAGGRQIIAGNDFLADYARRINPRVRCIPTPVDTTRYFPSREARRGAAPVIGWIGSPSTAKYLQSLAPVFERLAGTRRFRLKAIGTGQEIRIPGVEVEIRNWNLQTEAAEFRECDIGIYPLWDDQWSKGKCGYKALQFMASGVPVIASAIGMNTEIIRHGSNGLLAGSEEDWVLHLARLCDDPSLRWRLGEAGRETIEASYSLTRLAPLFLETLEQVLRPATRRIPLPEGPPEERAPAAAERQDILCFSSIDWDFVWQGHQEIMTSLARQGHRVLFIENTGVRGPRLGDLSRIQHRLGKWRRSVRGFSQVERNLYVFSPLVLPFPYSRIARWINRALLGSALRHWVERMEFHRPVCWTFLPTPLTLDLLRGIPHRLLIYYCIDSFADSTPAARRIVTSEQQLLRQADLVFVTSRSLQEHASRMSPRVHLFPFGVSLDSFERARDGAEPPPPEVRDLRRPVVGYVGGIHQWVDQDLLCRVARHHPDCSFVMIGPVQTNVEKLRRQPNILLMGQRPHEEIPHYIKTFDVGIIPYRITDYTNNVYPTKLNEYLAMGKPVISTRLPEVEAFSRQHPRLVEIADGPDDFSACLRRAAGGPSVNLLSRRVDAARDNAWGRRILAMQDVVRRRSEEKEVESEDWVRRLRDSARSGRRRRAAAALAAAVTVTFLTPLPWWLASPLRISGAPRPADAVVVFAGGVGESGQPGEEYQEKVQHAVRLFQTGNAPRMLFVSGFTWTFREVEVMSALASRLGVPQEAIWTETQVSSTRDYVQRTAELARRHGWRSILLVTSPYHARRADGAFRRTAPELGIIHTPAPENRFYAHRWGIRLHQLGALLREAAALLIYRLRGWV